MHSPAASRGKYFFFCSAVPYQTRGSVPIPACALKETEKLPQIAIFSAINADVTFIHLQAAILFRNIDRHQAQVACFPEQAARDLKILRLNGCDLRKDLLLGKLDRRALNLALFVRKIFRGKNSLRLNIFDQEACRPLRVLFVSDPGYSRVSPVLRML